MAQTALNDAQIKMLLGIVARVEALVQPVRVTAHSNASHAAVMLRRESYFRGDGMPYTVGGSSSNRVRGHRDLRQLEDRGLVQLVRPGRVRLLSGKIDHALTMCNLHTLADTWWLLEELSEAESVPGVLRNSRFVHEQSLLGAFERSDALVVLRFYEAITPHLITGFMDTASDTQGTIGVRVTSAGHKALKNGRPQKVTDVSDTNASQLDYYLNQYKSEFLARDLWSPADRGDVVIPLSAGMWTPNKAA